MKIKSDYIPKTCWFLTTGREYEIVGGLGGLKIIKADNGNELKVNIYECAFLNGGSWDVVTEAGELTEVETLRARVKELELRLNSISNMSRV